MSNNLIAIYDFEFFPYALGDVLTWNIRTAMRCEELGIKADIYICLDEKTPASIYQRGLINPDNYELFFNELYSAFGTNPALANLFIFRAREQMLVKLQEIAHKNKNNREAFQDYLTMVNRKEKEGGYNKILRKIKNKILKIPFLEKFYNRFTPKILKEKISNAISHENALNNYFIKYVYSHEKINQFHEKNGHIPLLTAAMGCEPDIDEFIHRHLQGKKIVPFHLRLRRLDIGYGGDHTYARDSDFLEWYDFLKNAHEWYPDVQFIALGRLQEKPLEILRLPNVTSLRLLGMGLGHELTLMAKSDLFIGSSSGFAAFANFSNLPYFITRMNPGSCKAYAIPEKTEKLPFAKNNQRLIYEEETSELLMRLLESGLNITKKSSMVTSHSVTQKYSPDVWLTLHTEPLHSSRTTCRFYIEDQYRQSETVYMLTPYLEQIKNSIKHFEFPKAKMTLDKLQRNFPEICHQIPDFLTLKQEIQQYE